MKKLYDGIINAAQLVKNSGNTELYGNLLDLGKDALDMQEEIIRLRYENRELLKAKGLEERIERYDEPFITLRGDEKRIIYCARCWDDENKTIQVNLDSSGTFFCSKCHNEGIYDKRREPEWIRYGRTLI